MAKWNKGIDNDIYNAWNRYITDSFGVKKRLGYTEFETRVKKYAKQKNTSIADASIAIKDKWTDKAITSRNIHGYYYDIRKDVKLLDRYGNYTPAAYKLLDELKRTDNYKLISELQAMKENRINKKIKSVTASMLFNSFEGNKMGRVALMLANAGYTFEQAAATIGVSVTDIKNPNNWNGAIFMLNGMQWEFIFEYDGSGYINTSHFKIK